MPTPAAHPDQERLEHAKNAIKGVVAYYGETGKAALEAVAAEMAEKE